MCNIYLFHSVTVQLMVIVYICKLTLVTETSYTRLVCMTCFSKFCHLSVFFPYMNLFHLSGCEYFLMKI